MDDSISHVFTLFNKDRIIRDIARKEKGIIIGGQALKEQLGVMGRPSEDYDILVGRPEKSARILEKTLDKKSGGNYFFTRRSKTHPETVKVLNNGFDRINNTDDDIEIVDFSPYRKTRTVTIHGNKFATLSDIKKEKMKILQDKKFKFRHEKDKEDVERINSFNRLWWL